MKKSDITKLKRVLNFVSSLKIGSVLDNEDMQYYKEKYPKGFHDTYVCAVNAVIGDKGNPSREGGEYFPIVWKVVEYKNAFFIFRILFGQGAAYQVWKYDEKEAKKSDWVGDKESIKIVNSFLEKGKKYEICEDIFIHAFVDKEDLEDQVKEKALEAPTKFIEYAVKYLPENALVKFLENS